MTHLSIPTSLDAKHRRRRCFGDRPLAKAVVAFALPALLIPAVDAGAVLKKTVTATTSPARAGRSTSKVAAGAVVDTVATTAPRPTTTLPPRKAGTPTIGFGLIADGDWPAPGDSVTAVALGRSLEVLRAPDDRTGALRFDAEKSVNGPLQFLALGGSNGWVRVAIPVRPNGTVGWVKASDVRLQRSFLRITIDLDTNTMRVHDGDLIAIETKVGAGTGGTPTPTGLFFVKEFVPQANPNGPLGPIALGLSGFSTVLKSFEGGTGNIGIHGTNAPGKLGGDVSHGCIRVANSVITKIASLVPIGTPVEIVTHLSDLPSARVSSVWLDSLTAAPTSGAGVVGVAAPAVSALATSISTTIPTSIPAS